MLHDGLGVKIRVQMKGADVINKLSRTFTVLGDPTRVRIIFALSISELCVSEISAALNMTHSAVSHQMRALRDLNLVKCRKAGRRVYYLLNDKHIENLFEEGLRHVTEK
ncbi:MAG: metalloregulator ArsR/SmtB family transcription factor [Candidatus Omnitrophota bacterium]